MKRRSRRNPARVVVVGAGLGGLTAAALLRRAGHDVTVLEAHVYPGGSAGTFYHKKYRFDAGATLAGGFAPGGPHARLAQKLGLEWPVSPVDPAWVVHLPDGQRVTQWRDDARWRAERRRVFPGADHFWRRLDRLADIAWDISSRPFPWPPESVADLLQLAGALRPHTLGALPYLTRTVADLLPGDDPVLRRFVDAQLLISAQATADRSNALYGAAALDLPRRGVNHVHGGIGRLADTLVQWLRDNGAEVLFRQQVTDITIRDGRATSVTTRRKLNVPCDYLVTNLTPWGLAELLGDDAPGRLRQEVRDRAATWGAFTLYLGLRAADLPRSLVDHHQIIQDPGAPLGEGNSIFLSLGPAGDPSRAPDGRRPATLSTHTRIAPWWAANDTGREGYEARREMYAERLLTGAERAVPGLRQAIELCLPGTPVTFDFYTRRPGGMVGGFPQTSLFDARGPGTGLPNVWLVGDSIFPGQSTAGVTLGGMRVAGTVARRARFARFWSLPFRAGATTPA